VRAEKEKQAEELVLWRMASLPPPASGLQPHSPDPNDQTLPESCQAPGGAVEMEEGPQASTLSPEEPEVTKDRGTLTVIREDQVFLSCASGTLQGSMLTCR